MGSKPSRQRDKQKEKPKGLVNAIVQAKHTNLTETSCCFAKPQTCIWESPSDYSCSREASCKLQSFRESPASWARLSRGPGGCLGLGRAPSRSSLGIAQGCSLGGSIGLGTEEEGNSPRRYTEVMSVRASSPRRVAKCCSPPLQGMRRRGDFSSSLRNTKPFPLG